jgi:C4-dicarboxylate-specific signal transduction histidine kinase
MDAVAESFDNSVDYKSLFEGTDALCLILDPDFTMVAATPSYVQATGITLDDIVGRNIFDTFTDDPRRPEANGPSNLRASLQRVLALKRPDSMAVQRYDVAAPPEMGGGFVEKYWSPRNSPVLDERGEVRWIIHRVYDVTDAVLMPHSEAAQTINDQTQLRLLNELRAAQTEIARLDRLRARLLQRARMSIVATMASSLAHDLAQPLAAAQNYLAALRRRFAGKDELADQLIGRSAEQVVRAGEIVKGLRRFMRSGETEKRPDDFAEVAREAFGLAEPMMKTGNVALQLAVSDRLPKVMIDRGQIQQVLINLLMNAADAVRNRDRRDVVLSAHVEKDHLHVRVSDSGAGMPVALALEIFEPFTTTKDTGLGLGLPICQQIISDHGGKLFVESNTAEGLTIAFTLPFANPPATD